MPMPEEIPTNLMPDEPTIESVNLFGPVSAKEIAEHDNRQREEASYIDLVQDAFSTDNAGRNFYDYLNRKAKYEVDPDYDFTKHSKMLLDGIPSMWHDKFKGVGSLDEAIDLRDTIMQEMKTNEKLADNGFVGGLARMTSAVVDVDMLLPGIGPAKKMTTLARMARGAGLGTSAAVVTEAGLATFGETNDWSTLPVAALLGFTVGGALGGLQPRLGAGLSVKIVDDELGAAAAKAEWVDPTVNPMRAFEWDGGTPRTDPQPFDPYVLRKQEWRGTPEAMHNAAKDLAENAQDPDAIKAIDGLDHVINDYTGARVFVGDEGTMGERAAALVADLETRKALGEGWPAKFRKALANSPFADDATRLWESGSPTMRSLAVSLFEFADGLIVNNRSGAMLNEFLIGHTYKPQAQIYDSVVQAAWKRKGLSPMDLKGRDAYTKDLNRRVLMQANDLNLNRPVRLDDDVSDVLAGIRDMSEKFRKEGAGGFGGERAVPGFENLQEKAAYIPMPWHPDRLRAELIRLEGVTGSAKAARKKLGNALKHAYMSANPDMSEEVANQVSLALIRRQLAKGDVMDTNIQALLKSDDSRDLLVEALVDNGATKEQVEAMLNKLSASDVEKSTVSYGRRRTNIDLAGEYDGVKIIDLVDNDLQGVLYRYSDTMSKRIALSRHGIDSKRKMVVIKDQVKKELGNVSRADKKKVEEFLDYMFEYFEPGTVDKHINPWMRRAKGAVNLSLLSKLSITQSAETGAIISATGMDNFIRASKVMTQASLGKHKKALTEDFGFLLGNVAYERGLLRSDFAQDAALDTITSSSRVAQAFDSILSRGQHLQSMISGYTKVIEAQLNLGAIAGANKIFRGLKAGKAADLNDMFQSMGVTPQSIKSLQKLVDDGVIEFGADGHVAAMNVSRWPNRIREDFGLASLRLARQMTQRSLAGESMQWLHDPSWAIFGHLMNFPLLAMKKQFLRHAGRKDGQLLALTSWGMGTACLAAVISAGTEGREMTPEYLARRAFSLNNAIGWAAPGIDLFAVMTGLEEYAPGGRYAQEVSIPLLSVAERARGIPAAMAGLLPGAEFTASDKRAMQVLPVVGGAMFMGRVWDAARTDIEE